MKLEISDDSLLFYTEMYYILYVLETRLSSIQKGRKFKKKTEGNIALI